MTRLLEVLAVFTAIGGLMAFTSYQIDAHNYITRIEAIDIAQHQSDILGQSISTSLHYIEQRQKITDEAINIVREDVKEILKELKN